MKMPRSLPKFYKRHHRHRNRRPDDCKFFCQPLTSMILDPSTNELICSSCGETGHFEGRCPYFNDRDEHVYNAIKFPRLKDHEFHFLKDKFHPKDAKIDSLECQLFFKNKELKRVTHLTHFEFHDGVKDHIEETIARLTNEIKALELQKNELICEENRSKGNETHHPTADIEKWKPPEETELKNMHAPLTELTEVFHKSPEKIKHVLEAAKKENHKPG